MRSSQFMWQKNYSSVQAIESGHEKAQSYAFRSLGVVQLDT